jgi:hypothetical protein
MNPSYVSPNTGLNGFEGLTVIKIVDKIELTTYFILHFGSLFLINCSFYKKNGTFENHSDILSR